MGVQAKKSIAVLNLKSDQLSPTTCISVTNLISTELQTYPGFRIIAWDDVTKILEHQAGKQALGCDNDKCFVEIGGTLGVDYIVAGDISQLGSKYICNLKFIDVNKASTRNRVSETIVGDLGALTDMIPRMVHNLLYTLRAAARIGSLPEVERLFRAGADVNEKEDSSGFTPLHIAVLYGYEDIVEALLAKGADPNQKDVNGDTPLHIAAEGGNEKVPYDNTPLHIAAQDKYMAIVHTLLDNHAYVNVKNNRGATPLHEAAINGYEAIVNPLVAKGADVNAKDTTGATPLHDAVFWGNSAFVKALLDNGADVNAKDANGQTPLWHAAASFISQARRVEVMEILLTKGADANAKDKSGDTPLGMATQFKATEIVKLLKEHGATE
jgi:ankyrin repeat protein/TolB-like protein